MLFEIGLKITVMLAVAWLVALVFTTPFGGFASSYLDGWVRRDLGVATVLTSSTGLAHSDNKFVG
jgi:hypothetical protein